MKYFGTDGIRGNADKILKNNIPTKLGIALAKYIEDNNLPKKILIAQDTRLSGENIILEIAGSLNQNDIEVINLGITSTPNVSFCLEKLKTNCSFGIMVSASHNHHLDNGIKVFDQKGVKITPELELKLESLMPAEVSEKNISSKIINADYLVGDYLDKLKSELLFNDIKLVIDGANGSTYKIAQKLFNDKVSELIMIGNNPKLNENELDNHINQEVGSTHPVTVAKKVKETNAIVGFAFDGDGDRIIAIDEQGNIVDGDGIIYILANYYKKIGKLNNNTVVVTKMANLGLLNAFKANQINFEVTDVGDKYVSQAMIASDYGIGGEQSGHIIIKEHSLTGDGLLVAVMLLNIMAKEDKTLNQLLMGFEVLPQTLINIKVKDKKITLNNEESLKFVNDQEKMLETGRILLRASGTEEVVRVMVEAKTKEIADKVANEIAQQIT